MLRVIAIGAMVYCIGAAVFLAVALIHDWWKWG